MWLLVTCAESHRDHVEISTPKLLIHGLGHFSLVYPLLSALKKKKKKTVQNQHFPFTFIEMSFE